MSKSSSLPRILFITPEAVFLPNGMENATPDGWAATTAFAAFIPCLIKALYAQGVDVHVALPHYRCTFKSVRKIELNPEDSRLPADRVYLAKDRIFYYANPVGANDKWKNTRIALALQREVINQILPRVQPDIIHCHDWMSGLIPAMSRNLGIPCLFTVQNIETVKSSLADIEGLGIDAAAFWQSLFYDRFPGTYEQTRETNPLDLLLSGILAADLVDVASPNLLGEIIEGPIGLAQAPLKRVLAEKWEAGGIVGVLTSPNPSYNPLTDKHLHCNYGPGDHRAGKQANKRWLQKACGLVPDDNAALLFWPPCLAPDREGWLMIAEGFLEALAGLRNQPLQIVFAADGEFKTRLEGVARRHRIDNRVAIGHVEDHFVRRAYAASDFMLMPSHGNSNWLPPMIGLVYGSVPLVYAPRGIHDNVVNLNVYTSKGNGFLFRTLDTHGLQEIIKHVLRFYHLTPKVKERQIVRTMMQSLSAFNHQVCAQKYIDLYAAMLVRPLIKPQEIQPLGLPPKGPHGSSDFATISDVVARRIRSHPARDEEPQPQSIVR
ncbi:MAG: glycogen/starch synthase [Desulfobacterales bacterium]|nr:MAG: glycogen/starch synthase [Desulfobacterales bacterium]